MILKWATTNIVLYFCRYFLSIYFIFLFYFLRSLVSHMPNFITCIQILPYFSTQMYLPLSLLFSSYIFPNFIHRISNTIINPILKHYRNYIEGIELFLCNFSWEIWWRPHWFNKDWFNKNWNTSITE